MYGLQYSEIQQMIRTTGIRPFRFFIPTAHNAFNIYAGWEPGRDPTVLFVTMARLKRAKVRRTWKECWVLAMNAIANGKDPIEYQAEDPFGTADKFSPPAHLKAHVARLN